MEFKIGDRVRVIQENELQGAIGNIFKFEENKIWIDINGYHTWFYEDEIEFVSISLERKIDQLEQRIEKLEKEVFKPIEETKPSLLTEDERVILRNLDKIYDFIARDEDGDLHIFSKKPEKEVDEWNVCGIMNYEIFSMFNDIFQFIKWTDSEPYNIEELLKGECGNE